MRAVVLDASGRPQLSELDEPVGPGELVRVVACGLCGSDVEKLMPEHAGSVLGHEVVAETGDGRRVALVHHLPCGVCVRCLGGHETTCDEFREPTIVPGGFAERARAREVVELPEGLDDAHATYAEPLACVLRGSERLLSGRVLVVGQGFVGRLFAAVLRQRGDEVFTLDLRASRAGEPPEGLVQAAVVCAPRAAADAAARVEAGGTLLVFAPPGPLDLDVVYRRELHVTGSRSATPEHMRAAVTLLGELELPEPTLLPLERFGEGLARYRAGELLKVVFVP